MKTKYLFVILVFALCPVSPAAFARQNQADMEQLAVERADQQYEEENFASAYKSYLALARKGDPFSQYRVSYMNLYGQGVSQDTVQAYSWAHLAAESNIPQLQAYFNEVKAQLPESDRLAAEQQARELSSEWSKTALAIKAHKKGKRNQRDCTGSRLGTSCDQVYAMQMPKTWSVTPGTGGGDGGGAAPGGSISSGVYGGGGESRDVGYYQELHDYMTGLEQYIQNQAVHVELGEFEVLEPEPEPTGEGQ